MWSGRPRPLLLIFGGQVTGRRLEEGRSKAAGEGARPTRLFLAAEVGGTIPD